MCGVPTAPMTSGAQPCMPAAPCGAEDEPADDRRPDQRNLLRDEAADGKHSGIAARRGLWEVHHDPYDLSQVFVRTPDGWITAPWTCLPMISEPFADFTWRHARKLAAQAGRDDTSETEVARVLDELLTRAQAGPPTDKATARVAARTRVAAAAHRRHPGRNRPR